MNILGINYFGHDTSAAVLVDNRVAAAAEEERFTRNKHENSFPYHSIKFCLEHSSLTVDNIDTVALTMQPEEWIKGDFLQYSLDYFPDSLGLLKSKLSSFDKFISYEKNVRDMLQFKGDIKFYNHHECHFASSFYLSGFDDAALLSIDGSGEYQTALLGYAAENRITKLQDVCLPHSIGWLYDAVCVFLGFHHQTGAGKVMGLAAYGNPDTFTDAFKKIVTLNRDIGTYEFDMSWLAYHRTRDVWISDRFIDTFGPKRIPGSPLEQIHYDIAAALQKRVEEVGLNSAEYLYKQTGSPNICLAGGVALNCVMNSRILNETPFKNIFVQPAAGDAGTAIGASLLCYHEKTSDKPATVKLDHTYLGPEYSDKYIQERLDHFFLPYESYNDIEKKAAHYLADGKIIGWFQGRMEFGPRALGNRSILTAPFPAQMKDILNKKVKHRESFRPFAPSILFEDLEEYFDNSHESPYMLLVYKIHKPKQNKIQATAHVDMTGRVQTVRIDQNPKYYRLISEFKALTGIPVVLNTSYNDRAEPIVCSPDDAIKCFLKTDIDFLVIGNAVVKK